MDTNIFNEKIAFSKRTPIIGYLGRLSSEKGICQILDAARILRNKGIQFEIVGDGPLREKVEERLILPDMEHIRFSGWKKYDEIPDFLNKICLLLLPSSGEGLPNVVLEAMACSTPVLCNPVGGIPDLIINGETGFLLLDDSAQGLAERILEVMAHPNIEGIGRRGRDRIVENYSIKRAIAKWKNLFDEIEN